MDTTQLLLTVVLTVTTILMVIIGVQLIFVLKEIRSALRRVNQVAAGFEKIGLSVEHGFSEVVGFFAGAKTLFKIFEALQHKKDGKTK
ncbi:hypothetical protein GYA28_02840 [Candidatus Roizmanbacteria bacterium]|jgi:hypothetical protein|nr:hypothetical protein [Candidatus Roizmanbacteria bacterium]